ncbi:MAG: CAP domain-containing protein [Chloroflexi bacterium]|nr:CAP domain-containing protein [Chloroflexota bacterium]
MLHAVARTLRMSFAATIPFALALAIVPIAQAGLGANSSVQFSPSTVQVGGSGSGEITLTNGNDAGDTAATNAVCNAGDPCPTAAATETSGISVIAACQALGSGTTCPQAAADPDVFALSATGTGAPLSACASTIFDIVRITDTPTDFGRWRFTPRPGASQVQLPGTGSTCRIGFTYTVLKAPRDANPATPELETIQFTFHSQANAAVNPLLNASSRSSSAQTVVRAAPTIATAASAGGVIGTQITDTATVSGRVSPVAGSTVQFRLYGPDDASCAATPAFTTTTAPNGAGVAVSQAFTPTQPGVYRWRAFYSGDANNNAVAGACNDANETATIVRANPTIATVASAGVVVGGQITDTATVSGRVSPVAGSTVQFRLYGPNDASCASAPAFTTTPAALNGAGVAVSPAVTPTAPGVYRWRAFYSGDANNNAVAGACNDANETVTITAAPAVTPPPPPPVPPVAPPPPPLPPAGPGAPAAPVITDAEFVNPPAAGQPAVLEIIAVDPVQPINGAQVSFGEPRGRTGQTACRRPARRASRKAVRLRVPYTFRRRGKHRVRVTVLSGGCSGKQRKSKRKTINVNVKRKPTSKRRRPAVVTVPTVRTATGCADRFLIPTTATIPQTAAAVLCLVNVERRKFGRKPLLRSQRLTVAARGQSRDMLRRQYFDHEGPGGPSLALRLRRVGYTGVTQAENIGYGTDYSAAGMVRAWMLSPGHRSNILHPRLRFAGVGLVVGIPDQPPLPGSTYTMVFGATLR